MSDQAAPDTAPVETPSAAPEAATGSTETAAAPAGNDALMARMDEIAQSLQALTPAQQEQADQGGLADLAGQPFDPFENTGIEADDGDQYTDAQADPMAQLQSVIGPIVQQALAPHLAQQRSDRVVQQAQALQVKYPDLAKGEVAMPLVREAERHAQRIGHENNFTTDQVAAIAHDPQLIETLYLAQRARSQAAQETPADGSSNVQLEGASAQVDAPQDDVFDQMVKAGPAQSGFKWS